MQKVLKIIYVILLDYVVGSRDVVYEDSVEYVYIPIL